MTTLKLTQEQIEKDLELCKGSNPWWHVKADKLNELCNRARIALPIYISELQAARKENEVLRKALEILEEKTRLSCFSQDLSLIAREALKENQ